jgi:4-alpha-glucanotransferase
VTGQAQSANARAQLRTLARACGIDPTWRGQDGESHACSDETLLGALQMLSVDVARPEDARAAHRGFEHERASRLADPVIVAWDGARPVIDLRLPLTSADATFEIAVEQEDATIRRYARHDCDARVATNVGDVVHVAVRLPHGYPPGRHRIVVEVAGRGGAPAASGELWLIAAPSRIGRAGLDRAWGVFAPVYALHHRDQQETGDLGSFARLADWASRHGARVAATLPLLATFVGCGDEPCDPSPYSPVTRRFWNEAYLDLRAVPELGPEVDVAEPAPGRYANLARLAAARRPLLERALARLDAKPERRAALDRWLRDTTLAADYATFRSEREGSGATGRRVHAYAQWLLAQQLTQLASDAAARRQVLYFDLPVGAHRAGFDVHVEGPLFLRDASVGAPPDNFFGGGQDWGFPPIHPHVARTTGYTYLASCLRAHFAYAGALRIDHVMGLHRLWVIAPGASPTEGAYVRYAAEEQWAVVCIEAARANAAVVGEDLGTVPAEATRALRRHRALGTWVLQFETPAGDPPAERVAAPPSNELAAIGTHDLPTFAAWWSDLAPRSRDAVLRTVRDAGELDLDDDEVAPERVLGGILAWLGKSRSPMVLLALEDLWLEREPQNEPGASDPRTPRFCRRWAHGLDELDHVDVVKQAVERLDRSRNPNHRLGRVAS